VTTVLCNHAVEARDDADDRNVDVRENVGRGAKIASTPIARVSIDITTKVYGGCDGSRTIHIAIEVRVCAARQRDYASFGY